MVELPSSDSMLSRVKDYAERADKDEWTDVVVSTAAVLALVDCAEALKDAIPENIRMVCDECGGEESQCPEGCYVRLGRAALAKLESL